MKTLEQHCYAALQRNPDLPAIEFEGQWYTWGNIQNFAGELAQALEELNIPPGASVMFMPRNRPSALATLVELLRQGQHIQMQYAFQAPKAVANQLEKNRPAVLIADRQDFSETVVAGMREFGVAGIVLDGNSATILPGLETKTPIDTGADSKRQIDILTSGTTGTPKQFPVPYSLIENFMVRTPPAANEQAIAELPPALLYFPIGNITGIHTTVPPLVFGQRIVLLDRFSLEKWHDYVVQYRPLTSGIPPASMQSLLDANIPREDFASLKWMGSGAAPLPPPVHNAFEERYNIPILLSYGATEFGGPVIGMTLELHQQWGEKKFGSVGKPYPGGFDARVVDPNSHEPLPANTEGLLEVVSPRIGPDWIQTSDIGLIDDDGFVFLRGRADGAIMRGGFKVLPETIESALLKHPEISAVSVVAVPDKRVSEVPGAAIVLKKDAPPLSGDELESFLRESLLATQIPAHWQFVESLPKTPSFKIDRPAVKQLFAEQ